MAGRKRIVGKKVSSATAYFQRVAPRKMRYVADLIRGRTVAEAQAALSLLHRPSAVPIMERLLKSAAANSQRADADDLVIGRIAVDGGPMLKRWRPRAYGRAAQIRKRLSHITIELTEPVGGGEET